MKKSILLLIFVLFSVGFVNADTQQGPGTMGMYGSGEQDAASNPGYRNTNMAMAQIGNHIGPQGQQMHLNMVQNRYRLEAGGISADCDCNLSQNMTQNRTRLYAGLSNGRNAEIKIMPNTASETALQRLRLRNCNEDCEIELKEVGQGQESKLAYEIQTQKRARFLGMFGTQMQINAQVNAENGEVIRVNKPWWAFLASEENEIEE